MPRLIRHIAPNLYVSSSEVGGTLLWEHLKSTPIWGPPGRRPSLIASQGLEISLLPQVAATCFEGHDDIEHLGWHDAKN
eukprot:1039959-Pelagomonas_calceolata.AAC.3